MSMELYVPSPHKIEHAKSVHGSKAREQFMSGVIYREVNHSALDEEGFILLRVMPKEKTRYSNLSNLSFPDDTLYIESGVGAVVRADEFIRDYPSVIAEVKQEQERVNRSKHWKLSCELCDYNIVLNPNNTLFVGCHLLKISELERIAKLLGCE